VAYQIVQETLRERTEAVVPGALEDPLYGFQRFPGSVSFPDGSSTFVWDRSQLKIRVQQADGSWKIINTAEEASAAGLASGELDSLEIAYDKLIDIWEDRIDQLQAHHAQELVDILGFDLNEFLKVSTRLTAKQVFYVD